MIYRWCRTAEAAGALYDIADLLAVKSEHKRKQIALSTFLQNWESTIAGMTKPPDEECREPLFLSQVKHYNQIEHDLAVYYRAVPGEANRSFDCLMNSCKTYLQEHAKIEIVYL